MIYMEHEGVVYKGVALGVPSERWSPKQEKWVPYGNGEIKPVDWGSEITEAKANKIIDEDRAYEATKARKSAA